jgi:hypothetical protein
LANYDADVSPLIDVIHVPPIVAEATERVDLQFSFSCNFATDSSIGCRPTATLFVGYGSDPEFSAIPLAEVNQDSLRFLETRVAATDGNGRALQYYLEISEPQSKISLRYPLAGSIQTAVVPSFVQINLPAQSRETFGELVLQTQWGNGPSELGLSTGAEQATIGPDAFDIAADGDIALLDEVNQRVVLFSPSTHVFRNFPVQLGGTGDLAYSQDGRLLILNLAGEQISNAKARIPQLYRLGPNRQVVELIGPVFARRPVAVTDAAAIMDANVGLVKPVDAAGNTRPREAQRADHSLPELLSRWLDDSRSRFVDTNSGLAIEIRADDPIGSIVQFAKTNQGYVIIFEASSLRIVWLDSHGQVLYDLAVANQQYTPFNPYGRTVVEPGGAVDYLSSTPSGIEIRRVSP